MERSWANDFRRHYVGIGVTRQAHLRILKSQQVYRSSLKIPKKGALEKGTFATPGAFYMRRRPVSEP